MISFLPRTGVSGFIAKRGKIVKTYQEKKKELEGVPHFALQDSARTSRWGGVWKEKKKEKN